LLTLLIKPIDQVLSDKRVQVLWAKHLTDCTNEITNGEAKGRHHDVAEFDTENVAAESFEMQS